MFVDLRARQERMGNSTGMPELSFHEPGCLSVEGFQAEESHLEYCPNVTHELLIPCRAFEPPLAVELKESPSPADSPEPLHRVLRHAVVTT